MAQVTALKPAIQIMLEKYAPKTERDYANALKEIIQEVALLGLSRTHFFEHAAFHGGTALRILYGLDRFSEDLDFTLLKPKKDFQLSSYFNAVRTELESFGFDTEIQSLTKSKGSEVESAFIKANTQLHLLKIQAPQFLVARVQKSANLAIKFEIDTQPPGGEKIEAKLQFLPIPYSIKTLTLPCLFAGKMHALLYRNWRNRVKGRDWYDFVWYIARGTSCDFHYLREKALESERLVNPRFKTSQLTPDFLIAKLKERIDSLDIKQARGDVAPFISDSRSLDLWSKDFFHQAGDRLIFAK